MKYFQILLLLGINFSTILIGQSIEIPHKMISQNTTINIPIFIYEVDNLESIQLTIEYDDSIILAENIIENPLEILNVGYTFTPNVSEPGIIHLVIITNLENLFSGSGIVAQITFQSIGNLGEFSDITFSDVQINSDWQVPAVDGSIEIILDKLTITGQDNSGIGAEHSITLGMCDGCSDEWKFGQDEYDYPNPQDKYTNIHFYHPEWLGQEDGNSNVCNQYEFATDYRSQHSFRELTSWGIRGYTGGGLLSDIDINLNWDSNKLNSASNNFQMFIYVGGIGFDMQLQNSITISQSDLTLNANDETNIKVLMGTCADTGITDIYYEDKDGDGLGWDDDDGVDDGVEYCTGFQPEGLVTNSDDTNDEPCNGDLDCSGACGGTLVEDICGICGGPGPIEDCGCEDIPDGACDCDGNVLDECGVCGGDGSDDLGCGCFEPGPSGCDNQCNSTAETDCFGVCGGYAVVDDCGVCGGANLDMDCNGECAVDTPVSCDGPLCGTAEEDICGVCEGDGIPSGECDCAGNVLDCSGVCGGDAVYDICNVCGGGATDWADCAGNCSTELDCNGDCQPDNGCPEGFPETEGCAYKDSHCNDVCVGGSTGSVCEEDCAGIWGGTFWVSDCGCVGFNNSGDECDDCAGNPNGTAELDLCGNCIVNEEDNYVCEMDCNGIWGGNHPPTFSCQNGEIACNYNACYDDLANNAFQLPQRFDINRIYPNPFNPQATIDFEISEPVMVQLNIYNLNGQKVDILKNAFTLPGHYSVIWNGTNHPSGIYFVILQNSNAIVKQKMMLIK